MNDFKDDLSWLPKEPEEQLLLGFRIVETAYKTRVHTLESDCRTYQKQLDEATANLTAMQKRYSMLEGEMLTVRQRATQLSDENTRLVSTVRKLQQDVGRLENVKKMVLNSIQDGENPEDDHSYYKDDEFVSKHAPLTMQELQKSLGRSASPKLGPQNLAGQSFGSAPRTSPMNKSVDDSTTIDEAAHGIVDGKKFFRVARGTLSYEQFSLFLNNIKLLNKGEQTKEETLMQAQHIFGQEHQDLFTKFQVLLSRHSG
eukprot:Filipodium_phascolosomae@DN3657_c0_g1_i1.p1